VSTVTFSPDQEMAILNWLADNRRAGLTLDEIIEGVENGFLTNPTDINQSEQGIDIH
jgi:hypothetical protein